jgi:hypothetical protein
MPVKKQPKPSLEACQKLWALIVTAKDLSPDIERELLGHVYAIWPRRRRSVLQIWAYPEIDRLVNGLGTMSPERLSKYAACRMVGKFMDRGWKTLYTGHNVWRRKPLKRRDPERYERELYERADRKRRELAKRRHKLPARVVRKVTAGYVN